MLRIKIGRVTYDPQEGFGAVPNQMELEYRGFAVVMRANAFLRLVPPIPMHEDNSGIVGMAEALRRGKAVAPPFLLVDFEPEVPRVVGHEGRHRTVAIQTLQASAGGSGSTAPMLVHVFPTGGMRARHLKADVISRMRETTQAQRPSSRVYEDNFDNRVWFNSGWIDLDNLDDPATERTGTPVMAAVERRLRHFLRSRGAP